MRGGSALAWFLNSLRVLQDHMVMKPCSNVIACNNNNNNENNVIIMSIKTITM